VSPRKNRNLRFDIMLKQALDQWPEEIDVSVLIYTQKERNLYSVVGLHELQEAITSDYKHSAHDFLMVNLHWSILRVVHKAAQYMDKVNIRNVRKEAIKEQLDSLLDKVRAGTPDEFGDDAIALAKNYFLEN
jgi:hypothetical protein